MSINKEEVENKIEKLIREYYNDRESGSFTPGKDTVRLSAPSFGVEEVMSALDCFLSTQVTMGEKVYEFERLFSDYLGAKKGLMVNSGSSANLIALKALRKSGEIGEGDEVIVPACTWSTSVSPILDIGAVPVFVDSNPRTFNLKPQSIEDAITEDTKAVMAVHLLGNPADIFTIQEICQRNNLFLVEDCCESHGARVKGEYVGTFGGYGTYSFFFSHHISTMEGGMVVSKCAERIESAKPLRAHGWIREMEEKDKIASRYQNFDERFLFIDSGLNVRPTEIQGAFGVKQMEKLEEIIQIRRSNAKYFLEKLNKYRNYFDFQSEHPNGRHTWFGFPLIVKKEAPFKRREITNFLELKGIETRPIMGGNLAKHPAFENLKEGDKELKGATRIHENGFFFGNHHQIGRKKMRYVVDKIDEFVHNY